MTTGKLRNGTRLSVDEFMETPDTRDKRKMELDDWGNSTSCPGPGEATTFCNSG